MKKILSVLFLLIFISPAFAVPGWKDGDNDNVKFYDDSASQTNWEMLNKKFDEKHADGAFTGEDYIKEVRIPQFDFDAEEQRQGKPGFEVL